MFMFLQFSYRTSINFFVVIFVELINVLKYFFDIKLQLKEKLNLS